MTEEDRTEKLLQILYEIADRKIIISKLEDDENNYKYTIQLQKEIIDLLHRYICINAVQITKGETKNV
jgi:septum formation topological specificity factor MinE